MLKKITAVIAVLLAVASLASCGLKRRVSTHASATTAAEISTAAEETTTEETTTLPETTTAAPTTAKSVPTTARRITKTTKATKPAEVERTEVKNEREVKYGVVVNKNITLIYKVLADGSEKKTGERTDLVECNRFGYGATYAELLPAAKANREKYRSYINEILRITNGYRAEGGVAPLELDEELTIMSCARAEEMAWSGDHDHYRPSGKYFSSIFRDAGYTAGQVGENLGWGFETPETVCLAWKNSETHYENLMNPIYTKVGFGVAADPDPRGKLCWTQHFYGLSEGE